VSQTPEGALKVAAKRANTSVLVYVARIESGYKWCISCRTWHKRKYFGADVTRFDGLVPSCKESRNRGQRLKYKPRTRPANGRSFVPARDGDKLQARRRINYFVEAGLIPHPNSLPCADCSHVYSGTGRRHEYDHFLGYLAKHHESVEVVCSECHHIRERARRNRG